METVIRQRDRIIFDNAHIRRISEGVGQIILSPAAIKELSERIFFGESYRGLHLLATCVSCLAAQGNYGPCPGISPEFFNPVINLPESYKDFPIGNCRAVKALSALDVGSTVTLINNTSNTGS